MTVVTRLAEPEFSVVYAGMFPVPPVPKPTLVEEVHANVVPGTEPAKLRPGATMPLQ